MLEKDRVLIRDSLKGAWRHVDALELEALSETLYNAACALGATLDASLDAIQRHILDDTLRKDGRRRGEFPPVPADLKAQLQVSGEESRRYDLAEASYQRRNKAKDFEPKSRMARSVTEWTRLCIKQGAYMRGEGPVLTEEEQANYAKGHVFFKSEPQYPEVAAYWEAERQRKDPLVQRLQLLEGTPEPSL